MPRVRATSMLNRSNTTTGAQHQQLPSPPRYGSRLAGRETPTHNDLGDSSRSHSLDEDDEDADESSEQWGLTKDMELFEVSSKDDTGP
jgi:hypothetical protein